MKHSHSLAGSPDNAGMTLPAQDRPDFEALSETLLGPSAPSDLVSRVVYRSHSMLSATEHSELLVQCHRNNRRLGLTGMLVIQDRRIVQVLEGPAAALDAKLAKIRVDSRHSAFELLEARSDVPRLFPGWAMGSVVLSATGMTALVAEVEAASDEERRRLAALIRDGGSPSADRRGG